MNPYMMYGELLQSVTQWVGVPKVKYLMWRNLKFEPKKVWNQQPKLVPNTCLVHIPAHPVKQTDVATSKQLCTYCFRCKSCSNCSKYIFSSRKKFALWPNRVGLWKIFSCPISTLSTLTHMTALLSWTPANGCDFYCGRYEQLDRFQIQYAEVYKQYGWGWGQNPAKGSSNSRSCPACCEYFLAQSLGKHLFSWKSVIFPSLSTVTYCLQHANGVLQLSGTEATARFQPGVAKQCIHEGYPLHRRSQCKSLVD
jgi:hypothetical protein